MWTATTREKARWPGPGRTLFIGTKKSLPPMGKIWINRVLGLKAKEKGRGQKIDMLPSYRTMKYKSPIWGYFHVQKE